MGLCGLVDVLLTFGFGWLAGWSCGGLGFVGCCLVVFRVLFVVGYLHGYSFAVGCCSADLWRFRAGFQGGFWFAFGLGITWLVLFGLVCWFAGFVVCCV